jgi:hypothetical protein
MASVMQAQSTLDPIAEVLRGFAERRSALDDTFFKFNLPERGIGLLVDFIVRRRQRHRVVEVRASLYTPEGSSVVSTSYPLSSVRREDGGARTIGNAWLGPSGSRGAIGNVSWDLVFQPAGSLLEPQVIGQIVRPFDLRLRSVPDALFSGNITIGRHGYSFSHEPGTIGTFFGRRMPDRWYWISASAFDRPGVALECMLLDSSIFGLPFVRTRVGYLSLTSPEGNALLMHPLTANIQLTGDRRDFVVTARPRHGPPISFRCSAPEARYQHLGDRIYATLLGICSVDGLAVSDGLTALAERLPTRRGKAGG